MKSDSDTFNGIGLEGKDKPGQNTGSELGWNLRWVIMYGVKTTVRVRCH